MSEDDRVIEATTKVYFGCEVTAFKTDNSVKWYKSFPWRFMVKDQKGVIHRFVGIPNYVETKAKALRRGWFRAKWLSDGTYGDRYK